MKEVEDEAGKTGWERTVKDLVNKNKQFEFYQAIGSLKRPLNQGMV